MYIGSLEPILECQIPVNYQLLVWHLVEWCKPLVDRSQSEL